MLGTVPWASGGVGGSDFAVKCDLRVPTLRWVNERSDEFVSVYSVICPMGRN